MRQYNYIFWDFDGTLVNTVNGTRESAIYALSKFGIEEHNQDLGKIFCGPPLTESFKKFGIADEQMDKAIKFYRKYQSENTIEMNEVYSGINEVLKKLKESDKVQVIVTAKYQKTVVKILKYLKIYEYFDFIYGVTEKRKRVTKKEILSDALNNLKNIKMEECIMIGDRTSDIIAGKTNNIDTIGVTYGMDSKEMIKEADATFLIDKPFDIIEIIGK